MKKNALTLRSVLWGAFLALAVFLLMVVTAPQDARAQMARTPKFEH